MAFTSNSVKKIVRVVRRQEKIPIGGKAPPRRVNAGAWNPGVLFCHLSSALSPGGTLASQTIIDWQGNTIATGITLCYPSWADADIASGQYASVALSAGSWVALGPWCGT